LERGLLLRLQQGFPPWNEYQDGGSPYRENRRITDTALP
jgi:hypothetical protein